MKKVRASAPAKVILFGEHAVVYEKKALATAIGSRLYVEVKERKKRGCRVKIGNIPASTSSTFGYKNYEVATEDICNANASSPTAMAMNNLAYFKESLRYVEEKYDIAITLPKNEEGIEIEIKSEIPVSAGVGSSAATCVATIAAIKEYYGIRGSDGDSDIEETRKDAYNIEKRIQGAASPVDTAISTYGEYVFVEKDKARRLKLPEMDFIMGSIGNPNLSLGIGGKGNIKHGLKTKKLVELVKTKKELFNSIFKNIFNTIDEITSEGIKAMEVRDFKKLGMLMNINHGLLEAMEVVSGRLSRIVKASQETGALGAKVTGAGGIKGMDSGSVLVLPPHQLLEKVDQIKSAMLYEGAALVWNTKSAAEGLRIEHLG